MALLIYNPKKEPLDIVYYHDHILVINKPAGLLSVPGRLEQYADSATSRVREKYSFAEPAHRLDMGTSGLLIFALSRKADAELKLQFREKKITKAYYALVSGHLDTKEGIISLPLVCDWQYRPRQKVCFIHGKKSSTKYKVVKEFANNTSLVYLEPITGRTHQLRVHLSAIGHPILGDKFYAPDPVYKMSKVLCLHSSEIGFTNPITQEYIFLESRPAFIDGITKD